MRPVKAVLLMLLLLLLGVAWAAAPAPSRCLANYQVTGLGLDCHYACDDPVCHPLCVPSCRDPVCEVQCEPSAPILCNALVPSCSVRCPYDLFTPMVSDSCPMCETVCNPLPASCASGCSTLCEATQCGWQCRLPDECPLPRCELQCEAPACETPCAGSRLGAWGFGLLLMMAVLM